MMPQQDIFLGFEQPSGQQVWLKPDELVRGVNVSGTPGNGKTTLVQLLAMQLEAYWIFDYKDDYLLLPLHHPDCLVFDVPETMKVSLFEPPEGCKWEDWRDRVVEVIAHDAGLMMGSENALLDYVTGLFAHPATADGGRRPDLSHLDAYLRSLKSPRPGPQAQYFERVKNRVRGIVNHVGKVFQCSQDPLDALLDRRVVFRFASGLGEESVKFVTNVLLAKKLHARMARGHRGGTFRSACIVDEAHRWCDASIERLAPGRSTASQLILNMREYGEGVVTVCQNPSLFSPAVLANTAVKIAFQPGAVMDAQLIGGSMGLAPQEAQELTKLPPYWAAVYAQRLGRPIVTRVNKVERPPVVLAEHLDRTSRLLATAGYNPAPLAPVDFGPQQAPSAPVGSMPGLSGDAVRFLLRAADKPFQLVRELGFTGGKLDDIVTELRNHPELVTFVEIRNGKRGHQPSWVCLTDTCYARLGLHPPKEPGKGGDRHRFWQARIAHALEARQEHDVVEIEQDVNGKQVDVWAVRKTGEREAYEVQLGTDHALENVRKDSALAQADRLYVLVESSVTRKTLRAQIDRELTPELASKVTVDLLGTYL
jgi:hypothetical protein